MKNWELPSSSSATRTSGVIYDFLVKGFGFTALSIGIFLLLLMIYAFIAR